MNEHLAKASPDAQEGFLICLEAVEKTLRYIEDEMTKRIETIAAERLDAEPLRLAEIAGTSLRYGAQRALLVKLREGLRPALVDEDARILAEI